MTGVFVFIHKSIGEHSLYSRQVGHCPQIQVTIDKQGDTIHLSEISSVFREEMTIELNACLLGSMTGFPLSDDYLLVHTSVSATPVDSDTTDGLPISANCLCRGNNLAHYSTLQFRLSKCWLPAPAQQTPISS
jgi:hypothetical protein